MTRRRAHTAFLALACAVVGIAGCGRDDSALPADSIEPVAIGDQEDPVCGMLVRDQSAPRGQVRHRDGTTLVFCSLGDLLVHLGAPSRHGEAAHVFVEVLRPDEDPLAAHTGPHPWVPAAEAHYVVGVPRRSIMGPPVLSYADAANATEVALAHPGAQSLDFEGLRRWWRERN